MAYGAFWASLHAYFHHRFKLTPKEYREEAK
jgi:hypothetical protein